MEVIKGRDLALYELMARQQATQQNQKYHMIEYAKYVCDGTADLNVRATCELANGHKFIGAYGLRYVVKQLSGQSFGQCVTVYQVRNYLKKMIADGNAKIIIDGRRGLEFRTVLPGDNELRELDTVGASSFALKSGMVVAFSPTTFADDHNCLTGSFSFLFSTYLSFLISFFYFFHL